MPRLATPIATLSLMLLLGGCATIFSGTSDTIHIDSDPQGARIFIDGLPHGETPATLEIDRPGLGDTYVVLKLKGYDDYHFKLAKEFNAVSVLNLGNALGWAIDIATGAVMRYDRKGYDLEMTPHDQAVSLDALPRDAHGALLLPMADGAVYVTDDAQGLLLVFK